MSFYSANLLRVLVLRCSTYVVVASNRPYGAVTVLITYGTVLVLVLVPILVHTYFCDHQNPTACKHESIKICTVRYCSNIFGWYGTVRYGTVRYGTVPIPIPVKSGEIHPAVPYRTLLWYGLFAIYY